MAQGPDRNTLSSGIRIALDVVMLFLVALPSIVFKFADITPTIRGFFCDDNSIRLPYKGSTVSLTLLVLVGLLTNAIVFIVTELTRFYTARKLRELPAEIVCGIPVNKCIYTIGGLIWAFGFGLVATQSLTDIGKWTIGRLRPHFIDGCMIDNKDLIKTCVPGNYITNFTCTQPDADIYRDLRLSFPSGHASMSAYSMVFLSLYIQQRIPRFHLTYLFKHLLQMVAVMMAWFCALSRVMDNKHHWSDVLAGSLLGLVVAVLCGRYTLKSFREPYNSGPFKRAEPWGAVDNPADSDVERYGATNSSSTLNPPAHKSSSVGLDDIPQVIKDL